MEAKQVAKQKSAKPASATPAKVRVSHTVDAVRYRRFRVAAAQADKSESEMFEWLIDKILSAVHARGMPDEFNDKPLADKQGSTSAPQPAMMPSGPSYAQNQLTNAADDDDDEPVTAANVMSGLPEPTPGVGLIKRSKLIGESYQKATAKIDEVINDLGGR